VFKTFDSHLSVYTNKSHADFADGADFFELILYELSEIQKYLVLKKSL